MTKSSRTAEGNRRVKPKFWFIGAKKVIISQVTNQRNENRHIFATKYHWKKEEFVWVFPLIVVFCFFRNMRYLSFLRLSLWGKTFQLSAEEMLQNVFQFSKVINDFCVISGHSAYKHQHISLKVLDSFYCVKIVYNLSTRQRNHGIISHGWID